MSRMAIPLPGSAAALVAATLLLAGAAVWPWLPSGPASAEAVAPASRASEGAAVPDLPPLANLASIAQRPLFSPSRRPATIEKPAAAPAGFSGRYRLVGLIAAGGHRRALLAEGTHTVEIGEGEALDGWAVKRIEQDRLVLSSAAGETVLTLHAAPLAAAAIAGGAVKSGP